MGPFRSVWISLAAAALSVAACTPGDAPQHLADCPTSPIEAREDCRLLILEPAVSSGDIATLDRLLRQIPEVESRDLALLRLAIRQPERASLLCSRIREPLSAEKCTQVAGRPHLGSRKRGE
jgi:hypothetical protein